MPSTVFDSGIFRDAFGSPAMRAVFADESVVAKYVEVEVALAAAEAQSRRDPAGCGRCDQALGARGRHRPRQAQAGNGPRRLSDRGCRAPARQAMRRCRPLRPLGRHHPGHHGHRHGAANPRRIGARRGGSGGNRDGTQGACAKAPHHGDGGPHASPARPAGDLRLQGRRLARHDRPSPPAPEGADAARPRRPVRGCRRHAGLARRQGPRRARRADAGAGPRPPAHSLARGARRFCGDGRLPRSRDGHARQDRHRRDADDADRGGGSVRAVRRRGAARPRPCRRSATRSRAS